MRWGISDEDLLWRKFYSSLHLHLCHQAKYLAKYSVLAVEMIAAVQSEEELTSIVIWTSVGHGYQATAIELQPLVELILRKKRQNADHE